MFLQNPLIGIHVRRIKQLQESSSPRHLHPRRNIPRNIIQIPKPFRELNMRLVGQPRLAKHKHTVLVRRTDQLVRDLPRDRLREIDAPNFCCKRLVQGNEFERHVFRLMAAVGLCGFMCASGVGKPSVVGPGAAVGNSNADRELCGSLGLKCRVTPGGLG